VIGAALFLRSFANARSVDAGFDPTDVVTAPMLLLIVVIAVSSVPAWRATRVPAIEALRTDY
jgi:ABC-type lipoprotein release transport system permease subunit